MPTGFLCWMNKDEHLQPTNCPNCRTVYFSQLLKENLLSETIVSRHQMAFNCSNSPIVTVEQS